MKKPLLKKRKLFNEEGTKIFELPRYKIKLDTIMATPCEFRSNYFCVEEYLNYCKEGRIRAMANWFTLRQLAILAVGLDLVVVMVINAFLSIINFVLIGSVSLVYVNVFILLTVVIAQVFMYGLSLKSDIWEKKAIKYLEYNHALTLENIKHIPVKIIINQEQRDVSVLKKIGYYQLLESSLRKEELYNYNILKNEYSGTLQELFKVVHRL